MKSPQPFAKATAFKASHQLLTQRCEIMRISNSSTEGWQVYPLRYILLEGHTRTISTEDLEMVKGATLR